MSWTTWQLFSSAASVNRGDVNWSTAYNATNGLDSSFAYSHLTSGASDATDYLRMTGPVCRSQIPGTEATTTIDTIEISVRGRLVIGGAAAGIDYDDYYLNGSDTFNSSGSLGVNWGPRSFNRSLAGWGISQSVAWGFVMDNLTSNAFAFSGLLSFGTNVDMQVAYVSCRVEYTYTPPPGNPMLLAK